MTIPPVAHGPDVKTGPVAGIVRNLGVYLSLPVILLLLWQVAPTAGWVEPYLIPPPTKAAKGLAEILADGTLFQHLGASLFRSMSGFSIATLLAVPLGILIGWSKLVRKTTHLLLLLLMPIPITAWISMAILWFGIGNKSSVFLVTLGAAVPILVNSIHGVEWVDPLYVEAARTLGTGKRELLWRIVLPAALPSIFTGLRLGLRNSWAGLVVAEMIGAKSGIGYLIWDSRLLLRADLMIVGMLLVGIMGLLSDHLMGLLSGRMLEWHEGLSRDD